MGLELKRVLGEGISEGKKTVSRALHRLLKHFLVGDVFTGNNQSRFVVLALMDSLNSMDLGRTNGGDALEVVSLLAGMKQSVNFTYSP